MSTHTSDPLFVRLSVLFTLLGVAVPLGLAGLPGDSRLISELPLNGTLLDSITGLPAQFSRASEAYASTGELVSIDSPRFEPFAVAAGYSEWHVESSPEEFTPLAIVEGELFATDDQNRLWVSDDGVNFEVRGILAGEVNARTSAITTPRGTLLVGLTHWTLRGMHHALWRSDDRGHSFTEVYRFPFGAWPAHWNYTILGQTIFVSEYGIKNGASVHIYRSDDDGQTWQVVYDPSPAVGYHCHKILGDPWNGWVYQAYGDYPLEGMVYSADGGETWLELDRFHLPTSGVASRPDAVYWGSDGWGRRYIARFDRDTGCWTTPLRPWFGYTNYGPTGRTPPVNVYTMIDHEGIMYAPFAREANELWASADGLRWAFCWAGDLADKGIWCLLGEFEGLIHGSYNSGKRRNLTYGHIRFRPGRVATVTGLRLEPGTDNLLRTAQASSAEEGLDGWEAKTPTTMLSWDTSCSFHGRASVRCENPNEGPSFQVWCPALPMSLAVGTTVYSQIRLIGDESILSVRLYDEQNGAYGPYTLTTACDEWITVPSELTVTHPDNSIRLEVRGFFERQGPASVWLDAYQITETQPGSTWQLGGSPRSGETLKAAVAFPTEWTDFLCFRPDFSSRDSQSGCRTVKAWVQDADNCVQLVFDPIDDRFKLIEVVSGQPSELGATPPVIFWPGWTCRLGLRSATSGCELRVKIGAVAVAMVGAPLTVRPTELWMGSSPAHDDQAPGLYSLSRTFGGALGNESFERELEFLPAPDLAGDCNCDSTVNFGDINPFVLALSDPEAYAAMYPYCSIQNADINQDGYVDFADINPFVALLCND